MNHTTTTDPVSREAVAAGLAAARDRSVALLEPLGDRDLTRQHSPLMSPLVWDLAHVGNYEDLWLVRAVGGRGVAPELDDMYDAFRHPRPNRPQLPLLAPAEARTYLDRVRRRALDHLDAARFDGDDPLLRTGFVYGMVIQHEHQHDETMLATLQLMVGDGYAALLPEPAAAAIGLPASGLVEPGQAEVVVAAGRHLIGAGDHPWAYDNERPAHEVELGAYAIDATPVSNADYRAFVADHGYQRAELWSEEGWRWRQEAEVHAPQFWVSDGDGWRRIRFGIVEPVADGEPVQHVCWHEAAAYARWAGRRLPSEQEWEAAARLRAPGGGPLLQNVGLVWEWTASDFGPYPGFATFPYREYSEVFFGSGYKVLRGGSWATDASVARPTFRNWDWPIRRQIFAGFRTARSLS